MKIIPEEVRQAYLSKNLRPSACNVYPVNRRCCGIGALLFDDKNSSIYNKAIELFGLNYVEGFTFGFDYVLINKKEYEGMPFSEGTIDGCNAAKHVLDLV